MSNAPELDPGGGGFIKPQPTIFDLLGQYLSERPQRLGEEIAANPLLGPLTRYVSDVQERGKVRDFYGDIPVLGGVQRFAQDVAEETFPPFIAQRQKEIDPATNEPYTNPFIPAILPGGAAVGALAGRAPKAAKAAKTIWEAVDNGVGKFVLRNVDSGAVDRNVVTATREAAERLAAKRNAAQVVESVAPKAARSVSQIEQAQTAFGKEFVKGSPENLAQTIQDSARRVPKSIKDTMRLAARSDGDAMARMLRPKFQDDVLAAMRRDGIDSSNFPRYMEALRENADTAVLAQSRNPKAMATIARKTDATPGFLQSAEQRIAQRAASRAGAEAEMSSRLMDNATRKSSGNPVKDADAVLDNLKAVAEATSAHPNIPVTYPGGVQSGVGPTIQRVRNVTQPAQPTTLFSPATTAKGQATLQPNVISAPPPGGPGLPPTGRGTPPRPPMTGSDVGDAINAGSRFSLGFDIGIPGRQAFPVLFKLPEGPYAWSRGVTAAFLNLFRGEAAYRRVQDGLRLKVEKTGINAGPGLFDDGLALSDVVSNLRRGEEGASAFAWIGQKIPALKFLTRPFTQSYVGALNAVRTYDYLSTVWLNERFIYRRPLSIAEKLDIAKSINVITGRGFKFPKDPTSKMAAVASLSNAFGVAPNYTVARARLIPDVAKAVINMGNNARQGRGPSPGDLETVRNGLAWATSVYAMNSMAQTAGLGTDLDMDSPTFLKIKLGKTGPDKENLVKAAEFFGFNTQAYGGQVYLDSAPAIGKDIQVLFALLGPLFGKMPKDSKGHSFNPYDPKGVEQDAFDLVANWTANRGLAPINFLYQRARGRDVDMADPTQNPVTSLLIPLWQQSGMSASGASDPGGTARLSIFETPEAAVNFEKQRVGAELGARSTSDLLNTDYQYGLNTAIERSRTAATAALIQSEAYRNSTVEQQKKSIDSVGSQAMKSARRDYGIALTKTAAPDQAVLGAQLALESSGNRLEQARTVAKIQAQGSLTRELAMSLDSGRKQTDPAKAGYEPTVSEYLQGRALSEQWLAAPRFAIGTPQEWDDAAIAAENLKRLIADAKSKGKNPWADQDIVDFYAYSVGGNKTAKKSGSLAMLYERDGSKRTAAVSPARRAIQANPLWRLFGDSAAQAEKPAR